MPTFDEREIRPLASGIRHCEGIACGPDGYLYCGGYFGQVYRVNWATGEYRQYHQIDGGRLLGVALDADGTLYGCDCNHARIVAIAPDGAERVYAAGDADRAMRTPNWLVFDRAGNLYVSDSGDWEHRIGCIWKIAPGGRSQLWYTGDLFTPNGMALNATGDLLYVIDTFDGCIHAIPIHADGSPGVAERLVTLPRTMMDGLAVDAAGDLWVACHRPDALYRLALPSRRVELFVEDWRGEYLRGPTNLVFAGPGRDSIVTSSLDAASLFRLDAGIVGQPLNYPQLASTEQGGTDADLR